MANRFPLIVDSSGVAALKELPSGDNLDLTGNGIVGAGTVALTNLTVGGSQGTDGQVLTSTGSGIAWEDAASGGGGGAWSVISSQTVSSSVAYVTFTGVTGYENYKIVWNDAVHTNHPTRFYFQASTDNGSNWYSTNSWKSVVISGDSSTSSTTIDLSPSSSNGRAVVTLTMHQYNTNQKHSGEVDLFAFNSSEDTYFRSRATNRSYNDRLAFTDVRGGLLGSVAFNAIRFGGFNNLTGGTFTLYGLSTS